MTGIPSRRTDIRCAPGPGRSRAVIAAALLLFLLALQCSGSRAELLFRSAEYRDGQQHWAALRKVANPSDTAYPRTLGDGTQVPAEGV